MLATMVKHSERTNRRPCRACGKGGTDDKSLDLYWFHDASKPADATARKYCSEHESNSWILTERDGTPHEDRCQGKRTVTAPTAPTSSVPTVPVQAPVSVPTAPTAPVPGPVNGQAPTAAYSAFQAFIDALAPKVDAEQVNAIIDARLRTLDDLAVPLRIDLVKADGTVKSVKGAHQDMPKILKAVNAEENVLMVGPMGTGKSTMAKHIADALERPFSAMSVGPQTSKSDILGYMTADGTYIPSLFRIAWESGHVWLFDELDAAHPGVMTIINMALANGIMGFPDGMIAKHADTVLLAAANTYGRGPDRMYVGRQALDAATLDRFTTVEMRVDEALEDAMCLGTGLPQARVREVIAYVRKLRNNAEAQRMPVGFSPRASFGVCKLLRSGWTIAEAIEGKVRKGLSDQEWAKVTAGAATPH